MVISTTSYAAPGTQATPSADVYAKVERLMASQNGGVVKLNTSLARDQTKLSGLGQLHSALTRFQTLAQGLSGAGLSTSASATSKDVLTVSTGGKAVSGRYAVDVLQLAQAQVLRTGSQPSADAAIGTGAPAVIQIEFGSTDGRDFTPGHGQAAKSITIDSGNNSLKGIAAALKEAGIDASVVQSANGFALSLNGPSGAAGSMRISVTGDAATRNLLAYSPGGPSDNVTQVAVAQDALLKIDGKDVNSASNTLSDAIAGVSLSLTAKGSTKVVVARDATRIASNVGSLISAYNSLNAKLQSLQKGELKSDTALGQVSSQLSQIVKSGGVAGSALASAGVTADKDGNLQLDDAKLKAAIAADPDALGKLFSNDGKGLTDQLIAKIGALTGDNGGIRKEVATVGKDIAALNGKKAVLAKAMTAQATALVQFYAQQEKSGLSNALPGMTGGATSLFDFMR
ncbi:MAG: flagellar filament capping protein FliD [Pseudomonadota bacterium]